MREGNTYLYGIYYRNIIGFRPNNAIKKALKSFRPHLVTMSPTLLTPPLPPCGSTHQFYRYWRPSLHAKDLPEVGRTEGPTGRYFLLS